ncbi:RraA family protein [Variovorax sp. J22P240]|uniref:RraA family protein n=1 Tax=unclassified Variovorax TaxID=663243 RepID=UPI0025749E43|nr:MULTISPECIES: RraA family protein [unclassified Variovorax]MDL9997207.1 RraA family protein [Variovorax sp. J22P240]MDM0048173.1 RraA family protein [Variovorax sp. J22R115]
MSDNDAELFRVIRDELFVAAVGDVLDTMGYQHQFLPAGIAPLEKSMRIVGRAMPVLEADVINDGNRSAGPLSGKPFGLMLEALDDLKQDEIYIATGASLRYALWGGLMSTRARHLKAAGAILDGYVRDADEIERLGFNVFCRGTYAQDQGVRGQVIDYRCTIEIEGIRIAPGDLLFGDREGVLVVPRAVESEAVAKALDKVRTENKVADAIRGGMSACQALETFGVM